MQYIGTDLTKWHDILSTKNVTVMPSRVQNKMSSFIRYSYIANKLVL